MVCVRVGLSPQLDLKNLEYTVQTAADTNGQTNRVTYEVDKAVVGKLPNFSGNLELLLTGDSCSVEKGITYKVKIPADPTVEGSKEKIQERTLAQLKDSYPGYKISIQNMLDTRSVKSLPIERVDSSTEALISSNSDITLKRTAYSGHVAEADLPDSAMTQEQITAFKNKHKGRAVIVTNASGNQVLTKEVRDLAMADAALLVKSNKVWVFAEADEVDISAKVDSKYKTIKDNQANLFWGIRGTFQQRRMIYRDAPGGDFSASGGYAQAAGLKELSRSEAGIGTYLLGETKANGAGLLAAGELGYDRSWEWFSGGQSWATNYALTDFSDAINHQFHTVHYQAGIGANIGPRFGVRAFFGGKHLMARRSYAQDNIDESQTFGSLPQNWKTKKGETVYNGVIQGGADTREDGIPYMISPNKIKNGGYNVFLPYLELRLYGTF